MKIRTILIIIVAIIFTSCEKIMFDDEGQYNNDANTNFEYLWNQCDQKYSYFDVKKIDWASIKDKYSAKIKDDLTEDEVFTVFGDMLNELKDDHTNLISPFNISAYSVKSHFADNFDWRIVLDNYLSKDYYKSGPFQHDFIEGQIEEIGYIRFSAFTGKVGAENLGFALKRYKDTKGLILDLRENGGGAVNDVFTILGCFVDKETTVYYSRSKNGSGHNDFSEALAAIAKPNEDSFRYTKNVAVLIDRGTFSAGSFTSLATKAIPNMILIGDTTGGGLGLPNGGQLPNGWTYRFSTTQALSLDKKPDYEQGVPPDINASFDWTDLSKDEIIEKAILELKK